MRLPAYSLDNVKITSVERFSKVKNILKTFRRLQ